MDEFAKTDQNVNEIVVKHRKIEQINDDHECTRRVFQAKEKQLTSQLENEIENNVFVRDEFEDYKLQTIAKMQVCMWPNVNFQLGYCKIHLISFSCRESANFFANMRAKC
jgi:hypothetical protein